MLGLYVQNIRYLISVISLKGSKNISILIGSKKLTLVDHSSILYQRPGLCKYCLQGNWFLVPEMLRTATVIRNLTS